MCGVWGRVRPRAAPGPGRAGRCRGDAAAPVPLAASPRWDAAGEGTELGYGTCPRAATHPRVRIGLAGRQVGNRACIALCFLSSLSCFNHLYVNVMLKSSAFLLCIYLLYELFL